MKKILAIATVLLLVLTLFAGCGKDAQEITIKDQKNSVTATFEKGMTVAELLEQVGLVLGEKDEVTPALDTALEEPVEISVARYAKVNVVITEEVKEEATEAATEEAEEAAEDEAEEASEEVTEAAAPATKTVEVELVGGTVADALEEAGIKSEEIVTVNFELTEYLSDLEGDILVTVSELKVEEESATAEGVTEPASEAATEEATTAASATTTTTTSYYEDDEDDTTTTTRNRTELTTNAPVTDPEEAPTEDLEPVVTDAPEIETTESTTSGEKVFDRYEWAPGCNDDGSGFVLTWYTDGTYDYEEYPSRPDWV